MMELTCAVILLSASLVSANPHGYGVKGGASAKAESSASAGAFGGVGEIPVAVPLGTGYSGSFSKSSSSSSSSSASSSSSSSSSSFAYSGLGAGGFGLNGGAQGNGGCSSGNCQVTGGNGIPTPHGSSHSAANAAANAAATAEAGAVSGPGCQGLNCDIHSEKCASGQCKPDPATSIDSDTNKCKSGQCGTTVENGASPTEDGSNDIRVVSDSSNIAGQYNGQSSHIDKTSTENNGAGPNCSQGKCGPLNSKLNNYGDGSGNSNQEQSASNHQQQSSSSDTGASFHYQKPSTVLEYPKLDSKCKSGNCDSESHVTGYETSPSSHHVSIHGAHNDGERKPSCDGVKCENLPKGPYSPTNINSITTNNLNQRPSLSTDNFVTNGPSSYDNPSNCEGPRCGGVGVPNHTGLTGGSSFTLKPSNPNFGQLPSYSPTLSPNPTNPVNIGSNVAPGHNENKPSNDKRPLYTGGFGGPPGILNPNNIVVPATSGNPSTGHPSTLHNGKPLGSVPSGCNSPSCSGYPSASGPNAQTGTYNHKPGIEVSTETLPTYSGGFGGPSGILKPNEFDIHAIATNKPNYAQPGSSSYNTQPPLQTTGTSSNEKLPTYTGGFGAPDGLLNPDKYDIHATGPTGSGHPPSGTNTSPISSGKPGDCKTSNCHHSLGSTAAANAQADSFVTKPSLSVPSYTGGSGGPSGVTDNKPQALALGFNQTPPSPGSYLTGCTSRNCAGYPTSGTPASAYAQPGSFGVTKPYTSVNPTNPAHPQYTGGFRGPPGILKPNEYITPSTGNAPITCKTPNCVNLPTGDITYNNEKPPPYTGGFGGAPGLLKPNEYSVPSVSATPNNYNTPIGVSKPAACTSGHCNPHVPHGSSPHSHFGALNGAHATAAAAAEADAYIGGFGGPPGVLEPYDSKVRATPTSVGQAHGSQIAGAYHGANIHAPHGTIPGAFGSPTVPAGPAGAHGNTRAQAGSIADAAAFAGAAAGATAGAHGYNKHEPHYSQAGNIKGGSPCAGGCGDTSGNAGAYNSGSNFDLSGGHSLPQLGYSEGLNGARSTSGAGARSLAGANAFGVGGSFASSSAIAHSSAGAYTKGGYGK